MLLHTPSQRQPARLPLFFSGRRRVTRILRAAAAGALLCTQAISGQAETIVAAVGSSEPPGNPAAAVRSGVELAVHNIPGLAIGSNAVRVITAEDQCSAAGAEAAAKSLVAAGVSLVVGHVCSSAAIAAAPIYAQANVIFISPGARSPKLTDPRAGPLVFRLAGRNDRQAAETAAAIMHAFPGKKAAIVNDESPQFRDLADAVHRALTAANYPIVHRDSYTPGDKDYAETVRRLKIAGPDVVFLPAQPSELVKILAQMRSQQLDAHVIAIDTVAVPDSIPMSELTGGNFSVMLPWVPKPTDAALARVQTLLGLPRGARAIALQSYAAVEAWARAVADAANMEPAKIAAALAGKEFNTVIGRLRFNQRGDASIPSYALHVWQDGAWHRNEAKVSTR